MENIYYKDTNLLIESYDLVIYDDSKYYFKSFADNEYYCNIFYRNKEEYVLHKYLKPIKLDISYFKKDLFLIENGVNEVFEETINFYYKKIDLPFHIEYSESFGFKVVTNEYEFKVEYLKEIINLFKSFKIDTFSESVCLQKLFF